MCTRSPWVNIFTPWLSLKLMSLVESAPMRNRYLTTSSWPSSTDIYSGVLWWRDTFKTHLFTNFPKWFWIQHTDWFYTCSGIVIPCDTHCDTHNTLSRFSVMIESKLLSTVIFWKVRSGSLGNSLLLITVLQAYLTSMPIILLAKTIPAVYYLLYLDSIILELYLRTLYWMSMKILNK